ncbi:MAG: hypothetical protein ACYC40_03155 [Patescibacteria group bacterium]
MGKDNIIGKSLLIGAIEGLVINVLESAGNSAKEKLGDYLKSNVFNIGTNDEELYLQARAYALEKKWVDLDELAKITKVIDEYEPSQRRRIVGMLGKREGDGSVTSAKLNGDGTPVIDPKTKEEVKETTNFKTNVAGAHILRMFAKMTPEQIKKELDSSGAANSLISDLKKVAEKVTTTVENSEIKKDGDTFFGKETWFERKLKEAQTRKNSI